MENTHTEPATGTPPPQVSFTVTEAAAARINKLKNDEKNPSLKFRITVKGGGCSGFQYDFDLDASPTASDDHIFTKDSVDVVIDAVSIAMLSGSSLDFTEDLSHAGFSIKNPNATARCGCGNSFSVTL